MYTSIEATTIIAPGLRPQKTGKLREHMRPLRNGSSEGKAQTITPSNVDTTEWLNLVVC